MKRLLVILVVASVATVGVLVLARPTPPAPSPPPQEDVSIAPRWKAGDTRLYELVKSIQQTTQGKTKHQGASRSRIEVSVIEAGKDGYLVGCTIQETELDDPKAARDPMVRRMADLAKGWKALIELDAEATVTGLRNWRELQARGLKTLELLTEDPKSLGIKPAAMNRVRAQIGSLFARREQVEQLFLRDMGIFFLPLGRSYPRQQAVEYEDEVPNPLGGEPLPTRGKLRLTSYDEKTGRAGVRWSQTIDSEAAIRIILDTMRTLGEKVGEPTPDAKKVEAILKMVDVEDRCEFVIDARAGWVEELSHTRTTNVGPRMSREEVVTIKHIEPTPSP